MSLFHDMMLNSSGGLTQLTQVASSSINQSATITYPTISANDFCVLFDFADGSSAPTDVTPPGFTLIHNTLAGAYRAMAHYKILDGSESGTTITGMNGSIDNRKLMNIFRPNAKISNVTVSTVSAQLTSNDPTAQIIAMSGQQTPLIGIAWWSTVYSISRTYSPINMTEVNGPGNNLVSAYAIYNAGSTPIDITIDAADPGIYSMIQASWYLKFS